MDKATLFHELEDLLGLESGTIKPDMVIKDQAFWDSMAIMTFIAFAEEKFNIVLDNNQIKQAVVFDDLTKLFDSQVTG